MHAAVPARRATRPAGRPTISLGAALVLAISCGLASGYLEVTFIVLKKYSWNVGKNLGNAVDFAWTVPLGHALLLLVPGLFVALVARVRPKPVSLRAAARVLSALAVWAALLRLPLYGIASLILAAGLGRPISAGIAALARRPRPAALVCALLLGALPILAAVTSGWRAVRELRAIARLPAPPSNGRNVVLIVWDTVRAGDLGLYGYSRPTTPHLAKWARKGVRYTAAVAPGCWTYPSHTTFFTGYWPFQLISQWTYTLDAPVPTLAEHLAAQGYETVGFSANTLNGCYETRLDRGFAHFVDYPLSWHSFLSRTVVGSWLLENVFQPGDFYAAKWIRIQSRDAIGINREFLDWLGHRQPKRPFFAYLNYMDAHTPYVPPLGYEGRFGIKPRGIRDYRYLLEYDAPGYKNVLQRDIWMARDCYDDCIAFLDEQLGMLLGNLDGRGLLDNTVVIVTSDHGESFGQHGLYLHGVSLFLDEIGVPLVILAPEAPADRVVAEPVSLRDLPATVCDLLRLGAGSPFPGHSLAAFWTATPGQSAPRVSAALAEHTSAAAFRDQPADSLKRRDVQMSLVASGWHYIRDGFGVEQLYDLSDDALESRNLVGSPECEPTARALRKMLLDELDASPGAVEAETAYLDAYRRWLRSLVGGEANQARAIDSRGATATQGRRLQQR